MKYLTSAFLTACFAALLISCEPSNSDGKHHQNATHKVELNNGEKWEANPATIEGIDKMLNLVTEFEENNRSDYEQLQAQLQKEFSLIFERCTMTGEAHNQLHNYLAPLSKVLKKMEKGTAQEKENALKKLKNHLNSFNNFFK